MFYQFIIFFILTLSLSIQAAPASLKPIVIQNVDITTWPNDISAEDVLSIYIEIMNSDPQVKELLDQVNAKLNTHGITHLKDIFSYCLGEPPAKGATASFSQNADLVATRIAIPGLPSTPWPSTSKTPINAFSSAILKTPFIEFLVVSDRPKICIHKGQHIFQSYDSVVHEMTHFLLKDPFSYYEDVTSSLPLSDFLTMTVHEVGGELDAFKSGGSASIRFLRKYGINHNSESHIFFNSEGELADEEGLKNYLIKTYSNYYDGTNISNDLKTAKLSLINAKLKILNDSVKPLIESLSRPDLHKDLNDEIEILVKTKSQL